MLPRNARSIGLGIALLLGSVLGAAAQGCPGNPNALGTSRVLAVNPAAFPMVGKAQYQETLRLRNREVVLTFDDGPVAPYTSAILDALAAECVKATFFTLGENVVDAPDLVRRAFNEGHTIGTHTYSHKNLAEIPIEDAKKEIEQGIAAAIEALGNPRDLAPFFRPPFLQLKRPLERHIVTQKLMVWSIDVDSEDWNDLTEEQLVADTVQRLEKAGKGILLMHDIQPVTMRALPALLAELKKRKFRIVHVVPAASPARTTQLAR
jgi:peptidoglycan/xylan/chitin deacetylase (PgdA/CDA1 family)